MDEVDYAKAFADRWLAECLEDHRRENQPPSIPPYQGGSQVPPLIRGGGGGVGICIDCGEPISPARLAAQPGAVRCIECQRDFEMNSRRKN